MEVRYGLYKRVFIFNKIVIKTPKSFTIDSIQALYWEQLNYIFSSKKVKKLLLPVYFIPFIPILIQIKTKISKRRRDVYNFIRIIKKNRLSMFKYEVLHDIKCDNLGWYKGRLYKIDYDSNYRLYNLWKGSIYKIKKLGGINENIT